MEQQRQPHKSHHKILMRISKRKRKEQKPYFRCDLHTTMATAMFCRSRISLLYYIVHISTVEDDLSFATNFTDLPRANCAHTHTHGCIQKCVKILAKCAKNQKKDEQQFPGSLVENKINCNDMYVCRERKKCSSKRAVCFTHCLLSDQ